MNSYDPSQEATACTNELYYRYGPDPRDIRREEAEHVKEKIEQYLHEAYAAGQADAQPR